MVGRDVDNWDRVRAELKAMTMAEKVDKFFEVCWEVVANARKYK